METSRDIRIEVKGVSYLPVTELARRAGVVPTTIHRWIEAGGVRGLTKLRGKRYGSIADTIQLKLEDPDESRRRGALRTPEHDKEYGRKWAESKNARTGATAMHKAELWEDADLIRVVEMRLEGANVEAIAKAVGRTYQGVEYALSVRLSDLVDLRHFGGSEGTDWLANLVELLTESEKRTVLATLAAKLEAAA